MLKSFCNILFLFLFFHSGNSAFALRLSWLPSKFSENLQNSLMLFLMHFEAGLGNLLLILCYRRKDWNGESLQGRNVYRLEMNKLRNPESLCLSPGRWVGLSVCRGWRWAARAAAEWSLVWQWEIPSVRLGFISPLLPLAAPVQVKCGWRHRLSWKIIPGANNKFT